MNCSVMPLLPFRGTERSNTRNQISEESLRPAGSWYFRGPRSERVSDWNHQFDENLIEGSINGHRRCNGECGYELEATVISIDWTKQYWKVGTKVTGLTVVWTNRANMDATRLTILCSRAKSRHRLTKDLSRAVLDRSVLRPAVET